jgi:hypothetical protein
VRYRKRNRIEVEIVCAGGGRVEKGREMEGRELRKAQKDNTGDERRRKSVGSDRSEEVKLCSEQKRYSTLPQQPREKNEKHGNGRNKSFPSYYVLAYRLCSSPRHSPHSSSIP